MNRVGEAGKGESIWLGWFLYTTLEAFAPLADIRRDDARACDVAESRDGAGGVARARRMGRQLVSARLLR